MQPRGPLYGQELGSGADRARHLVGAHRPVDLRPRGDRLRGGLVALVSYSSPGAVLVLVVMVALSFVVEIA